MADLRREAAAGDLVTPAEHAAAVREAMWAKPPKNGLERDHDDYDLRMERGKDSLAALLAQAERPTELERERDSVTPAETWTHLECEMDGGHIPIVTILRREPMITCGRCGLCLDFRPLRELDFNTSDWNPPEYKVPETRGGS